MGPWTYSEILLIFLKAAFSWYKYFMQTLKKLIYKSHYRGTKEGDFLLSSFAKCALASCSDSMQKIYGKLLECTDAQIQAWVLLPQSAPHEFRAVVLKIAEFHNLTA